MKVCKVFLETIPGQGWMAHLPELLGCFAYGNSKKEVLQNLRTKACERINWLLKNKQKIANFPDLKFHTVEIKKGTIPNKAGGKAAFFSWDEKRLAEKELQLYLKWMELSRQRLLQVLKRVPSGAFSWKPDRKSWSIKRNLLHICWAEWWYISRLAKYPELHKNQPDQKDLFSSLKKVRRVVIQRLKKLTPQELSEIIVPDYYTNHSDEKWSARKVVRRFLEHEAEHTENIQRILKLYLERKLK